MEDVDDNEVEGEELPKLSLEVKLKELLRNLNSDEFKLCLNASKDFIKLLGGHAGGELLRLYVQASSKLTELDQAWNLQLGKPGFSHVLKVISAILSHPDGVCKSNDRGGVGISRALDKFARSIFEEKLGELYKELNSKEAKRQNAALLLLASVVRRGSGLASDVAKGFDFKLPIFPKLAEYKAKRIGTTRKHSTRQAFVGFAMSFLEVGKPGLLRWVLQQKEMYSGVLRGIGSDDDETVVYVLSTLRDMVLIPGSLVPPSLRSVLFGSITLEQLVNISGREDGGVAAELAHKVLVIACTDPSNGLMPDLNRQPNPLKGNIKRLLDLMKKLKATEVDYHRDLLLAIVKGRPLFGSAYMDEFPYNVEDNASPNWFAAVSLAANLISSVGSGLSFNFKPEDPPLFSNPDVQSLIKCICPHPFSRAVINKGLLHTNSFMKHGTLRLVLEELKLLDSFINAIESNYCSSDHMRHKWLSLKQNIQNEVRILLPDTQVLLSLLSSLSTHSKSLESSLKRTADFDISLEQGVRAFKRFKTDKRDDVDILVSGVCDLSEISSQDTGVVPSLHDEDDVNAGDDNAFVIADIWGLRQCSEGGLPIKNEQTHFYSRLLDAFKIYHRTIPAVVEGSFDFFRFLPSNPLALPTILQQSLLSLLLELIGWSSKCKIPVRIPPLMYKHLQPFVRLLLYSPSKDIKDQAHILARAAMLSTGAFDKNLREIGAWFLFLPGYNTGNIDGDQAIEVFQNLFTVIVSFICDAVSTVGNNLFKYWDVLRHHTCHLKEVEDVSPEFGPLFICVLEKCLRVISSESGTFTTAEKSMIALYVCNTIKYLLQTQVEKELMCSLVDHLLSGRVEDEVCFSLDDGDAQDLCEWRPLKSLFLFSRNIRNPQRNCSISRIERKLVHSNGSFANILGEVKRVLRTGSDIELIGISKAFVLSILSTPPAVILQHFPSVISASKNLSGFPFSVLSSIFFLEPNLLFEVSKLWPEMFYNGLQSFIDMIHGKEPMIDDVDTDAIESSSAAFCLFLKQAPFYVLFPCTVIFDGLCVLEGSNLQYLLQHKFPEVATDGFVSSVLLVLFWFHQIRLSYGIKPLAELEQLSGTCSILIEEVLGLLQDSPCHSISEVAEVIIRHPAVMLSLQNPLGHKEFPEGIFSESTEDFFVLARQGIHKMDHHVLNLLTLVCKCLVTCCSGQKFDRGVEYLKKRFLGSFKALVKKLNRLFRDRCDECIKTGDLRPLTPTLYALHTLIHFISPLELLELVLWIFSKIDLEDSALCVSSDFSALLVGLSIAGSAFDMLSTYLQKPNTQEISSNIFWEMEEKPFFILPFESIYFQLIKLAMRFELDAVDLCLLKAVNVTNKRKAVHAQCFPLSMDLSRVMHNTPVEVLSQFIRKTSMTRSKMLFLLTELSPIHLSVFGHCFSDVMNEYSLPNDNMTDGTCSNKLSDDNFLMLVPAALSYLISASMKYGEQFHKCVRSISSFYSTILFRSFSDWKSYVTKDIFNMECIEFLPSSMEELLNLLSQSLLGKSICMLGYYFAFNKDAVKLKKRLKLLNSICPRSGSANEDLLDCDVREIDAFSLDQSLNLVNRVVAKIHFCRMLLLPKSNQIRSLLKEDGNTKEIYSEVGSNKEYSSRVRFMNFLVHTWHIIVRKFPSDTDDPEKFTGKNYVLYRFLEVFILRNILELAREICDCPFIEQLARLSLLHRFGDPPTLKMLRGVLALFSGGNSHILVLQLLLTHSQFAPSVHSRFQSSEGSQFGLIFRPMASILRLLTVPFTDESALNGETRLQKTSEMYRKQLEVVRLLRALFRMKAHQGSFDFEKDIDANPRELLFLLLSSYSATLSEVDLEIFSLMLEIESSNVSNSGSIAEMDYLWGSAAIRIRKEREREQDLSSHMMKDVQAVEDRRTQFRENLPIDPKLCAYTVLHFPYGRNAVEVHHGDSDDMNEINYPNVERVQTYDPVFILRFSIHSLLMGYVEPVEFTSLGLLAIAFVSISSPHEEMRKLGYEALGGFKNALEKCQKRKDLMRLRLLLTYLQNGIEEPWQRIPSITAKFVAEASVILLDPSHDHYSAISKFLMGSARVNMKSVPLFATFLWSSSVNFRADRLWILRLLYAGLDSYDDAQIYIRNNILQILLGFYSSPLSDIDSKELILLVLKKSLKVRKLAHHLVEQCSIISWLSSIVSVLCGKKCQAQTSLQFALLNRALEVVNDVISTLDVIEWLQQFALEQLSELSTHLYKLLVGGNLKDKVHLVTSVLKILTSTLKISQERKVYQPHFTLSVEGLFQIYKVVEVCCDGNHSHCAELGLEAILFSTPPGTILCMEADKLCMFVGWATSTALQSSSAEVLQPGATYCDSAILFEPEQSEDSLISKLLRWLTASVILGRLSFRSAGMELNFSPEKSNVETLLSFLKLNKNGCGENKCGFGCEEMLAASIFGLHQLLGRDCTFLPSVVSALSLLLLFDLLHLAGSETDNLLGNGNTVAARWLRVRCPIEANPSWRWSFHQPWKDLSSKSTDSEKMDELHACQSLLVIISNVIGKKSLQSQFLLHEDLENCGVFNWERSILESQ